MDDAKIMSEFNVWYRRNKKLAKKAAWVDLQIAFVNGYRAGFSDARRSSAKRAVQRKIGA